MSAQTDALTRAIDYLKAVEVAPGRYALDTLEGYFVTFSAEQATLLEQTPDNEWPTLPRMPSWWTPKRRFAVVKPGGERIPYARVFDAQSGHGGFAAHIITADLETGEEIPA